MLEVPKVLILRLATVAAGVHSLRLRSRIPLEVCDIPGKTKRFVYGKAVNRETTGTDELNSQEIRRNGKRYHGAIGPAKIHAARNRLGKNIAARMHLLPRRKSLADYGAVLVLGAGQGLGD